MANIQLCWIRSNWLPLRIGANIEEMQYGNPMKLFTYELISEEMQAQNCTYAPFTSSL